MKRPHRPPPATLLVLAILCGPAADVFADLALPAVFGGNMVLRRDIPVPVRGRAKPGEKATVAFAGRTKQVDACMVALIAGVCAMGAETVKVGDFGAVPGDGKSDTAAIRKAIDACKGKANVRLVFAGGRYDLGGGRGAYLRFKNVRGLTIEGGGAELVARDIMGIFTFDKCSNVTIRNLTIDVDPLPFSGGKVVGVGKGWFDLEATGPHRAAAGMRAEGVLGYDPAAHRLARRGIDIYQLGFAGQTRLVRPGVMRVPVRGPAPRKGEMILVRHRIYGCNGFTFSACENVTLTDVNVYTVPGMGVYARDSRDFTLKRFNVIIRPKSGRWMSATADATHFNTCRGTITLEDCIFEGMGDDATNLHGMYMTVSRRAGDRTLRLVTRARRGKQMPRNPPRPGDRLEVAAGATPLTPYATLTVEAVKPDPHAKEIGVKFAEPLPARAVAGDVVANATACPAARIRRCIVRNNRARGMLIQTRDAVVEDCKFEYCSGAALHITCDADYWWEAIGTRKVVVRGNTFTGCNFGAARRDAVICIFAEARRRKPAPPGAHSQITIEGNTITGADGAGISIGSADGVTVSGNTFDRPAGEAILVKHTRNVTITGNTLTGGRGGVKIGPGCDRDTIKVRDNKGF